MSLIRMSFTGVDDINLIPKLNELSDLVRGKIVLEWGFLYHEEKPNGKRNINNIIDILPLKDIKTTTCLHLCGKSIFEKILLSNDLKKELPFLFKFDCIQLNINAINKDFTDKEFIDILSILIDPYYNISLTLQYNGETKEPIRSFLETIGKDAQVRILVDESKGNGILPKNYQFPIFSHPQNITYSFAGGLNEYNLQNELNKINSLFDVNTNISGFGIDIETGIRTNNKFDIIKVKKIIDIGFNEHPKSLLKNDIDYTTYDISPFCLDLLYIILGPPEVRYGNNVFIINNENKSYHLLIENNINKLNPFLVLKQLLDFNKFLGKIAYTHKTRMENTQDIVIKEWCDKYVETKGYCILDGLIYHLESVESFY